MLERCCKNFVLCHCLLSYLTPCIRISVHACSFLYIVTWAAASPVWRGAIMYLREMNNGRGRIVLQDLLRLLHNLPWGEKFREASHAIDKLFVPAWGAEQSRLPPTSTPRWNKRCQRRCWQTLQPLIVGPAYWSFVESWGLSTWKLTAVWIYLGRMFYSIIFYLAGGNFKVTICTISAHGTATHVNGSQGIMITKHLSFVGWCVK